MTTTQTVKALARTKFKKGDVVYEIGDWNSKSTVYARKMTVESWGKVRATASAVAEDGSQEMVKYAINVGSLGHERYYTYYVLASDVENLEALLMQHAVEMRLRRIAHYRDTQHWYEDAAHIYHVGMRKECQAVIDSEPMFRMW